MAGALAHRGVDDHLDLAVGDHVQDVGASLVVLVDAFDGDPGLGDGLAGVLGRQDLEARLAEPARDLRRIGTVGCAQGDEHGALQGQDHLGRLLGLVEGTAGRAGNAQDFAGGPHLGSQDGVDLREHVEGEDGLLDAVVGNILLLEIRDGGLASGQFRRDDLGREGHHADAADLGDQRDRAGCAGIGLQDEDDIVLDGILHVHQTDDMHLLGDPACILADGLQILLRNMSGGDDAGRVTRVDAGQLDVFHDRGHKGVRAVADRVRLALHGIVQEAVDQDGTVGCDADGRRHVVRHLLVVVDDFHAASAQDVRGTDHDRITDLGRDLLGLFDGGRHAGLGHGDAQLVHHGAEVVAVLRQVDDGGGGAQDLHALLLQLGGQVQRGLAAELGDDADGFFFLINGEDILQSQGLEIELV